MAARRNETSAKTCGSCGGAGRRKFPCYCKDYRNCGGAGWTYSTCLACGGRGAIG